jgi:hypothetical protein
LTLSTKVCDDKFEQAEIGTQRLVTHCRSVRPSDLDNDGRASIACRLIQTQIIASYKAGKFFRAACMSKAALFRGG